MFLSLVRRSSGLVARCRQAGEAGRGRVSAAVSLSRRTVSTSPLSYGVLEGAEDHGGGADGEDGETATTIQPLRKWNIDPLTGKRRVGNNWNYHTELSALAHRVGIDPLHLPSLQVALRERGVVGSSPKPRPGNIGRLSVLGHSVMQYYIHEYLYFNYPRMEGDMLKDIGNYLKSESVLLDLSLHLGVTQLIQTKNLLSDPANSYVVMNAFSAMIGVLYEKQGGKAARAFVHDFVLTQLANKDLSELVKLQHPRFMLYAILKSKGRQRPVSRLIKESGRTTHFPSFVVGVYSGEEQLGEGCGTSIKRAEKEAMVAALRTHFQTEVSNSPLPSDHDDFVPEELLQLNMESENSDNIPPQ